MRPVRSGPSVGFVRFGRNCFRVSDNPKTRKNPDIFLLKSRQKPNTSHRISLPYVAPETNLYHIHSEQVKRLDVKADEGV